MSSIEKKINQKEYWRSMDQLAETPEFKEFLHREFPEGASELNDPVSRRKFLSIMGASMAMAGLASCRRPVEKIVPYVKAPEEIIPGVAKYYATTLSFGMNAYGVLVESHEGRPTKIEGNELHPSSLGSSNSWLQASLLNMYDPDRSKFPRFQGRRTTWARFVEAWTEMSEEFKASSGEGLAVLSQAWSSPTMARLQREFLAAYPRAKWVTWEPVSDENIIAGVEIATGSALMPVYSLENAQVVLSLNADLLLMESENIRNNKGFAKGRKLASEKDRMNRLYVAEPTFTITGGAADHRLRVQARQMGAFTAALALELDAQGVKLDTSALGDYKNHSFDKKWLSEVTKDLRTAGSRSLVVAGRDCAPEVHALVYAINDALGTIGNCVSYYSLIDKALPSRSEFAKLTVEMSKGDVKSLVLLGTNPVYDAPEEIKFTEAFSKLQHSIHIGLHVDETGSLAEWHINGTHALETWGDARSVDGTLSLVQPLIAPLFEGKSDVELLYLLAHGEEKTAHDITQESWSGLSIHDKSDKNWRRVLHDGVLKNSSTSKIFPRLRSSNIRAALNENPFLKTSAADDDFDIVFTTSPSLFDGRFSNNGWMHELPDPVTKVVWENVALLSVATAKKQGFKNGDIATLNLGDVKMEMPVWIQPGLADNTVALEFGYGRNKLGRIADGSGFNVYPLRSLASWNYAINGWLSKTGKSAAISNTQDHNSMEGRALIREASLDHYRKKPDFAPEMVEHPPLKSIFKDQEYNTGNQWAMAIDLTTCTGCSACTIACQSENNIPIVGKEQVGRGREMHWMRMDRYFSGDLDNPEMAMQPVACQHCELAPCEEVCPVAATTHDKEGLNVMAYNRCIGTRYCSNNCPYKARRFNFLNYTNDTPEIVQMAMNPDVTIRFRGVMEKCTYCLQRINEAKHRAKVDNKPLKDGDVVTACQQTCPADAIVFGNILDPESKVSKVREQNRNYTIIEELNNRPRTTYQAKIRNTNPALVEDNKEHAEHV
ncbi:MAG: TAT-variant-translocated molybdopterin oxidoreductase [Deferribacteres bacterium]|nr:TAT-variant-translocated molybdopterin oxidoreductase [candidate division KSB1 bacterium]MCB9501107.1 TAT-variant-translocated molybdopterin oxidoreductase [Deferribacteres bacterium]